MAPPDLEGDVQTVGVKVGVPGVRVPVTPPVLELVGSTVRIVRLTLAVNVGVPGVLVGVAIVELDGVKVGVPGVFVDVEGTDQLRDCVTVVVNVGVPGVLVPVR